MSNELGATKITELVSAIETSDNEDDEVVSNILNELEGTGDDQLMEEQLMDDQLMDEPLMNEQLMDNLSDNPEDMDESDNLFNTDNNIFNTSDGPDTTHSKSVDMNNNNLIEDNKPVDDNCMDISSYLSTDMQELFNLVKYPILAVIVVLLINNEFVVKHLSQIKIFITDEKINMYGYALQAVLTGLILLSITYIINICSK